jgi:ribosomal-protein-alanine N-acetyltransferase
MTDLETDRVLLRRFTDADQDAMIGFYGEPAVMANRKYGVRGPAAAGQAFAVILAHWRDHGFGLYAAHDKATGAFMGECGLRYLDDGTAVEISYGLFPAFRGRGLATEAAVACLAHGFGALGLERIVARSRFDNFGSHRVLEKCGMHFVGREQKPTHDVVCYEATAAAWRPGSPAP